MQNLLNRIEREYILNSLGEVLPAMTLQHGSRFLVIDAASYRVSNEVIEFNDSERTLKNKMPVCVHFRHKERGMFFDSVLAVDGSGAVCLRIPSDIYKVVADSPESSGCRMLLNNSEPSTEIHDSVQFPLDSVFIDPEYFASHKSGIEKLAVRVGLDAATCRNSPIAYRLFEYIESFRSVDTGARFASTILYVDSSSVLVSVPKTVYSQLGKDSVLASTLWYVNRRIECESRICGMLQINNDAGIILLDITAAQIEDKRFLHERLFRNKYQG